MCGICGFYTSITNPANEDRNDLVKMTSLVEHRGPDSKGFYFKEIGGYKIGLGHSRLSIIDLSENADQPMENVDGSVVLIFNGEIYNFRELTKDLKSKGHIFKSRSDTEVIIHLYEEFKEGFIEKIDGMFSLALLDKTKQQLLLARDRLGIKPLFYAFSKKSIYFASEIKAILSLENVSRELDHKALDSYITFGYIPGDSTIFRDIRKLPPSSLLRFSDGNFDISKYWKINYLPKLDLSEKEIQNELFNLVSKAVVSHLVSDVPVGAFLSGGIDSSIIVALMNEAAGPDIKTFSIGYASGGKDELEYAMAVAHRYKTDHQEFRIDPDMIGILPKLLWHLDEPFFDNSIIPSYLISQLARNKVVVALSGDGGDEMFGGYEWSRRYQYNMLYNNIPEYFRKSINKIGFNTVDISNEYGNNFISKFKRLFYDLNNDLESGFHRRTTVSHQFRQKLYSAELKDKLNGFDAGGYQLNLFNKAQVSDEREKTTFVDTMSFLPDDCLYKVDRMSMANGLEVRVPFLDRNLVEFSARIPFKYKIRGLNSKYILKNTFKPYLPPKILKQRKMGFTIPISNWLKGKLGGLVEAFLLDGNLERRKLFSKNQLKFMIEGHKSGQHEFGHRLWSIAVFEMWARLYLDEKVSSAPDFSINDMI